MHVCLQLAVKLRVVPRGRRDVRKQRVAASRPSVLGGLAFRVDSLTAVSALGDSPCRLIGLGNLSIIPGHGLWRQRYEPGRSAFRTLGQHPAIIATSVPALSIRRRHTAEDTAMTSQCGDDRPAGPGSTASSRVSETSPPRNASRYIRGWWHRPSSAPWARSGLTQPESRQFPMQVLSPVMSSDEEFRDLVKVRDPNRLLEGEDPGSTHVDDATHWVAVYGELLGFKETLVEAAASRATDLPEDAQPEAGADLTILEAERQRLERRYQFWHERLAQLRSI